MPSYVDIEVSNEVVAKTYEALQLARQNGRIRKGANEVTKSVERGLASFVVVATDVKPEEVVMHIPMLCKQKKIAYSFVPSKLELGKSIGMTVPCAAIAVESAGGAANAIKDITARIGSPKASAEVPKQAAEKPKEAAKPAEAKKPKEAKQAKPEAAKPAAEVKQ
jgi:large subunit ribosomal protein L7Ae